ncbi:MAG: DMT family transporter [Aggregatilineales bacterium]
MTTSAIALVLLSALLHALWNTIAKRATGGAVFIWMFSLVEFVLLLPAAVFLLIQGEVTLNSTVLVATIGSGCLHTAYFLLLSKGYQVGDLSVVYPLARAIGPFIATFAAILLFSERPTVQAFIGGMLICGGVFYLTGDPRKLRNHDALPGIIFAGLTGLAIAGYTIWDARSVSDVLIPPLFYLWAISSIRALIFTPYIITLANVLPEIRAIWTKDKYRALVVGVFSPASYLLILVALTFSPVSYVAPLRVVSTLIGVMIGVRFLGEGDARRRLGAASVMVLGVFMLALG